MTFTLIERLQSTINTITT